MRMVQEGRGRVERSARPDTGTSHGICGGCLDNFEPVPFNAGDLDDIPPGCLEH